MTLVIRSDYVGTEVLIAIVVKSSIIWYITPCSPLKVNRRFGGTEDGGDIFFRSVGLLSTDYTALYPIRKNSSRCDYCPDEV
jgi:hypothetical protein